MDIEKKARKSSLAELRRLRQEGSTNLKTARIDDVVDEDEIVNFSANDEDDGLDLGDFVEQVNIPKKRHGHEYRPLAGFFSRTSKGNGSNSGSNRPISKKEALENDHYFKSLMEQMEEDSTSSESENEPESMPSVITANKIGRADQIREAEMLQDEEPSSIAVHPSSMLGSRMDVVDEAATLPSDFAPFDLDALNEAVIRQLESGNWSDPFDKDEQALAASANQIHIDQGFAPTIRPSKGMGSLEDFMKENEIPLEAPDNNQINMNQEPSVNASASGMATEYTPPGDGFIDFYWIDAFERSNGTVFLFGKVKRENGFVSACVTVNNIQRNLFFLPREFIQDTNGNATEEEVTLKVVYEEIAKLLEKFKINRFGCKRVTRKYGFEIPDMPVESDYLKIVYGFNSPQLPFDVKGRTFSHVFGTNSSALELFLLKRKMMGPGWLRIRPTSTIKQNISWCKVEIQVENPKDINVIMNGPESPPLTVMSIALRTIVKDHIHEIVLASALIFNSVSTDGNTNEKNKCSAMFSVVRDLENLGFPAKFVETMTKAYPTKLEIARNERALLAFLITMIHRYDPDVISGHNFLGFDLGILLHRMRACKVDYWSRLGRLNWSQWPKAKAGSTEASYAERQIVSGRLVCDTYLCAKDLVKAKSYGLQQLVETILETKREEFDYDRVADQFSSPDTLSRLLRHAEMDAYYNSMIMFKLMILPLTKQLTTIAGNLWSRTLSGGRAERNEYLLLHEFHEQKYICPDKPQISFGKHQVSESFSNEDAIEDLLGGDEGQGKKGSGGRRKPAYAGGLVLEPKKGFYDKIILLLDFNSLYPSIIQEYNICFTTVARDSTSEELPNLPDVNEKTGILPRVLKTLVERRAAVKRNMKDPKTPPQLMAQYNIRQQALKLTANSMYGCLGFSHSRFYAKALAMLITAKGREILQSTVELAQQQCKLEVIYGDTDSIMISTGTSDLGVAKKLAQQVKRVVNERYKLLEIELDGVFEKLLLLKKKKYSALVIEEKANPSGSGVDLVKKLEMKGLDMVRRDWAQISVETCSYILDRIMYDENKEDALNSIHKYLTELGETIRGGQLPLEAFVINKNLTKDPEAYADAKAQPHVQVALRLKQKGQGCRAGDTIPYVICCQSGGNGSESFASRAYHPDEVRKTSSLSIDAEWYLNQQIHPPVLRLCEHIEGTDSARLAICLGLDSKRFSGHSSSSYKHYDEAPRLMFGLNEEEKFKDVHKLEIICPACMAPSPIASLVVTDATGAMKSGLACQACSVKFSVPVVYCQALGLIRKCLAAYHQYWLECDEPACKAQTQRMRVYESRCVNDQCRGSMYPKISGQQIYYQLLYLKSLFDFDKARTKVGVSADNEGSGAALVRSMAAEYEPVRGMILHQLNQCSFPVINLKEIFSFMTLVPSKPVRT